MSKLHPNHRVVKTHRTYTVSELAELFGLDQRTPRSWIRRGLPVCRHDRPKLVHGADVVAFLKGQRVKRKQTLRPGEIYCVGCRAPRRPANDVAEYEPWTLTLGRLVGSCPVCKSRIYRRVNPANMDEVRGTLTITLGRDRRH